MTAIMVLKKRVEEFEYQERKLLIFVCFKFAAFGTAEKKAYKGETKRKSKKLSSLMLKVLYPPF